MKKVHIDYTKGCCWRRVLDAKLITEYFSRNGYAIEKEPERADLNVLFTCAFIEKTEEIAFNGIERYKKYPGRLVVAGCLTGINPRRLKRVFKGDDVGAFEMEKFDQLFPHFKVKYSQIKDANKLLETEAIDKISAPVSKILSYYFKNFLSGFEFHKRFYLRIIKLMKTKAASLGRVFYIRVSWGCNNRCAYCVEWKAVGSHKSKPRDVVLAEFRLGKKQGHKKFALVADDPGAWWQSPDYNFTDLMTDLIKESDPDTSFIIDGLNPKWLIIGIDKWVNIIKQGKIRYLMIALQSGDDGILKKMNRHHTANNFITAVSKIKRADPNLEIVSQVIVGFPGESEGAFDNTLKIIKKCDFINVVLFPYCQREGTVAARLPTQIPGSVIEKRIEKAKKFLGRNAIFHFHFEVDV